MAVETVLPCQSWIRLALFCTVAAAGAPLASAKSVLLARKGSLKFQRLHDDGHPGGKDHHHDPGVGVFGGPGADVAVIADKMMFVGGAPESVASNAVAISWSSLGAGILVGIGLTTLTLALLAAWGKLTMVFPRKQDAEKVAQPGKSNESSGDEFGLSEAMVREESFTGEFYPRLCVLVALLALQSLSSYILADFGALIATHPHLIYFLTMLVGLGGNAGGQSVVLAVRRLALGLDCKIFQQTKLAVALALVLGPVASVRATLQGCSSLMAFTIGLSAGVITLVSVGFGTLLPTLLDSLGFDPAHSAPMIQVAMDMIGISIVCILGTILLGSTTANF